MSISTKNNAAAVVNYNQLRVDGDKGTYIGAAHSDITKDLLSFQSSTPKRTADSYGNRRSTVNLLRGVSVANPSGVSVAKDFKIEMNFSVPVGLSDADWNEAIARIQGLSAADLKALAITGKIQF